MPPLTFNEIARRDATRYIGGGAGFASFRPVTERSGAAAFRGSLTRHIDEVKSAQSGKSVYVTIIHSEIKTSVMRGDVYSDESGRHWEVLSVKSSESLQAVHVREVRP